MNRAIALLAVCPFALGLNPALDVSQYAHTAWRNRDGFNKGMISTLAQTPDGYLWIGTEFGLSRFDGVKNVPWAPPAGHELPSTYISNLLTARDGTLWIGTLQGLASWKDGKLTRYKELDQQLVSNILEDREGTVWVGTYAERAAKLCAFRPGSVQCLGEDGILGRGVPGLYQDRKGTLWVGMEDGIWRGKPGVGKFYPLQQLNGFRGIAEDADGAILISTRDGVKRLVEGKAEIAYAFPAGMRNLQSHGLFRDRDGGLWVRTDGKGLMHVQMNAGGGRRDFFGFVDGLSGDNVSAFLEDREGNVWVATTGGLDRFRELPAVTYSVEQGASDPNALSIRAARDGSVWIGTVHGLNRWQGGQLTVYREKSGPVLPGVKQVTGRGLPDFSVHTLYEDDRGRMWIATRTGIGRVENDRYVPVSDLGGDFFSMVQDKVGDTWVTCMQHGLIRMSADKVVEEIPWARLGLSVVGSHAAADPVRGGLWLGSYRGGLAYYADGEVRESYREANGLGSSQVNSLHVDGDGTVWAATERGLSRIERGRIRTLASKNGLPCDAVQWMLEDDDRATWLGMACGLARIEHSEMEAWAAGKKEIIRLTMFDNSDGVRSRASLGGYSPHAAKGRDGRLWFKSAEGVEVVDPRHLVRNSVPPPVAIEHLIADRKDYAVSGRVSLPARTRDLQIDYTALSFAAPEKVRFRYMLEGKDKDWQEAGGRRQAFYNDLAPQDYRFRVIASNNDRVWNEAGASLDFSVAAAYYQTLWFRLSTVAVFFAAVAGLYGLRLRQISRQFDLRMTERVNERMRIARDLHDTLLQSFQGVLLKFHAATYLLPDRMAEARKLLETGVEQARQAIAEGRDAIQGLRSSALIDSNLAQAIGTLGEELCLGDGQMPDFRVQQEGTPQDLVPIVRDEVYRIVGEAMRNAFRHAEARQVEVEIRYDPRQFRLRVRDDGKGIGQSVLEGLGPEGHYGLPGMKERARLAGGKLEIWSELDSGTEIEVTISADLAYARQAGAKSEWGS